MIDAYRILGIAKDADEVTVKKAFRKLAKKYHPDSCKDPGAEERFKEVNEANRILNDSEEKTKHDIENGYVARPRGHNPFGAHGNPFGGATNDFFTEIFGSNPFAGFTRRNVHQRQHRQTMTVGLVLTLEEIYSGVTKTLVINNKQLEVDIPAGCENGETFLIEIENMEIRLQVQELRHPTTSREGLDLYKEIRIPIDIAVLGGEVNVEILGALKKVNIPQRTGSHKTIRIRGAGIEAEEKAGDLYLTARVDIDEASAFRLKHTWSQGS